MIARKEGYILLIITIVIALFPTKSFARLNDDFSVIENLIKKQIPVVQFVGNSYRPQDEGTTFAFDMLRLFHLEKEVTVTLRLSKVSGNITPEDFVGVDVIPKEFTVIFGPKETSKSFSLQTAFDNLIEGDETFMVEIVKVESEIGGIVGPITTIECTIKDVILPASSILLSSTFIEEDDSNPALVTIIDRPML